MSAMGYETGLAVLGYTLSLGVLVGNGLTILSVCRFKKLRTRANMYIVSLAATDAMTGLLLIVVGFFYTPILQPFFDSVEFACVGMISWGYCSVVCSGLNMCLIALDRCIYIAKPYLYDRFVTEKKVVTAIVSVWIVAIFYGTTLFYSNTFDTADRCTMREVVPVVFRSFLSFGIFLLCCVCTGVVYMKIATVSLHHLNRVSHNAIPPSMDGRDSSFTEAHVHRRSLRALKLFITVFGLLFVCWFPYFTSDFIGLFYTVDTIWCQCLLFLGFLNSGLNVLIYPYYNKDFRKAMKTLICCSKKQREIGATCDSDSTV